MYYIYTFIGYFYRSSAYFAEYERKTNSISLDLTISIFNRSPQPNSGASWPTRVRTELSNVVKDIAAEASQ